MTIILTTCNQCLNELELHCQLKPRGISRKIDPKQKRQCKRCGRRIFIMKTEYKYSGTLDKIKDNK